MRLPEWHFEINLELVTLQVNLWSRLSKGDKLISYQVPKLFFVVEIAYLPASKFYEFTKTAAEKLTLNWVFITEQETVNNVFLSYRFSCLSAQYAWIHVEAK